MKINVSNKLVASVGSRFGNIKITQKLVALLIGLLVGFLVIGFAYYQVLEAEKEAEIISKKMTAFENGIHEVQVDLLNARRSESEFYLKKYPIFLGQFDTRIIVANQKLKDLTNLVKDEKELNVITQLGEAFELYRDRFIEAAEAQIEIGLDDNTGLIVGLLEEARKLENNVKKIKSPELERSLLRIRQYENKFMINEDVKYNNLLFNEIAVFKGVLNASAISNKVKNNITNNIENYSNVFSKIYDSVSGLKKLRKEVKASVKRIEPLFESLLTISNQIIEKTRHNAIARQTQITTFFITTLITISVLVSVGLLLLAKSIINPMKRLQNMVMKVNDGDLEARSGLRRNDELGDLANAFDTLLDERLASLAEAEKESEKLNESVIQLIRAVSQLAQGKDLAVKIPVSEDITGAIGDSLNLLAKETAKALSEVKTTSDLVANVSSIVKKQSDHVISVAKTEREEVEATANMLRTSVKAMTNISNDAQNANRQADKTIEHTQKALDTVLSSVEGINSIRNTISETEKRIKRLGERSQEITGIVNLINSIAERTHILALNASMHAASAGEAGRGFAVVADEVQRLAENAREATSEIATVVNNIRVETADTVTTMNTVISQVAEGTRLAEQAGQTMKETQQATSELVRSVQEIANSSMDQVNVGKILLDRAKQIQESTDQTGRELLEQTKSTDNLVKYSKDLVSTVGMFKLPGDIRVDDEIKNNDSLNDTTELRVAG
ncbi:MAG: methyl-accepting chemotaxis protein [Gammaproteobacteria bacterium]|nr:methyl-accepting chemotaxis protein [Gammaproteobacteria bacterium]